MYIIISRGCGVLTLEHFEKKSSCDQADGLMNIVTGQVVNHSSVNVDKAQLLGKTQVSFERSWPGGFHDSIPRIVTTMALSWKHIKVGDAKVFDTVTIYARAMGLQSSARDLDTTTLMGHEL